MSTRPFLSMWVIYCRPDDFPDHFVARRHDVIGGQPMPSQTFMLAPTLRELYDILPPGLVKVPRSPSDDRKIVESWI